MTITMQRTNGTETINNKSALTKRLYYLNKSVGTREMTMAQCSVVANNIISGKVDKFCGRHFEVMA